MKYAVWLDGVILDINITDRLYELYKGKPIEIPYTMKINYDWNEFYNKLKGKIIILSPYNETLTKEILNIANITEPFIYNKGKTKPDKDPMVQLFSSFTLNPLDVVVIGSSPLDLLSARFYDSRVKVLCVNRQIDCSKYSPYLMNRNLEELYLSMRRLKLV
ncbi:HAD family hydrolase [Acidianus brierleyi]|uniref:HAD family hydrolase n=1 Tax=Acidianus brierleyi TaxID=41673 RepID=A0A2U9IH67_9CREN|nr:HAD family hydrolase [Acidianus brierleyi]AWR95340.1 HAD family hydrolase [Acidianus brierleyi]